MIKITHYLLLTLIILFFSCKNEKQDTYAIKDFRKSLQPFLFKIVTEGIVTYHDTSLIKSINNQELENLSRAENSVLRATAYKEMFARDFFNHYDIVMKNLGDTAMVATDNGEFGIGFKTVSDYILQNAKWKTMQAKDSTVEQVLTKHNYLRSAYTILLQLQPQEKYYSYIKDMATRPRRLDYELFELNFDDIEYALYGLAAFKKKEDVHIIKNKLMQHVWELSDISFRLMKKFPDSTYMEVLQDYHHRKFYKFSGNRPHGFSGFNADRASPEDFIEALVVQQNEKSAKLLDTMLTTLPKYTCMPDVDNVVNEVIIQVWDHPCSAYALLREKIRPKAEFFLKRRASVYTGTYSIPVDKTERMIRWYE